jgi:hypothetical protein
MVAAQAGLSRPVPSTANHFGVLGGSYLQNMNKNQHLKLVSMRLTTKERNTTKQLKLCSKKQNTPDPPSIWNTTASGITDLHDATVIVASAMGHEP